MTTRRSLYLRAVQRSQTATSTRAKLTRTAVAGAMLVVPVACGTGDEAAFSTASTGEATTPVDEAAPAAAAPTTTVSPATVLPATAPTTTVVSTTAPTTTVPSGVFPSGAELLVSFTYEPSSSAQAERPYVAVWVEDTDGNLVDTISVWFQQGRKGTKWLRDLNQWYQASGGQDTTMSGATRVAGDYTVAWDGTDTNGDPVAAGEYVLNIESAREHGPTSFTTGIIVVSDGGFTISLDDDGELSGAGAVLNA
ncbi:MAG: DUF2271 domain-containing protein [Actinomycetia bacterium]|nr:DUF2271 domain-containing protein [Actinomycetes bacterium]